MQAAGKKTPDKLRKWLIIPAGAALVLMTLIAYAPAINGGFVWDDDAYVTMNPLITAPDGLKRIWFSLDQPSQYFPLVYTTFRIEHALWGFDPYGFHVVNVILHILNALLVWLILSRLSIRGAWLAGAIFALHPVNVESVAWITERKNVLSTLFYLLAVASWLKFTSRSASRPWVFYSLTMAAYALALSAKTTACTLPVALVLVLWLKRERIDSRRIAQVVPFVILGFAMGSLSIWWERHHQGTSGSEFAFAPAQRFLVASRALWFYLGKLLRPVNLSFSYPQWRIDAKDPRQYVWVAACIAAGIALWVSRRRLGRGPISAVVFFVGTLGPMLGFVSLYTFRYTFVADHYQYVAAIGLIALFAASVSRMSRSLGVAWRAALSIVLLLILTGLTHAQSKIYEDAISLWRDTAAKNPQSWFVHANLGEALDAQGFTDSAIEEYREAIRLNPKIAEVHQNLGAALSSIGEIDKAMAPLRTALRLKPDLPEAHYNLAVAYYQKGQYRKAWDEVRLARKYGVEPHPEFLEALKQRHPEPGS